MALILLCLLSLSFSFSFPLCVIELELELEEVGGAFILLSPLFLSHILFYFSFG